MVWCGVVLCVVVWCGVVWCGVVLCVVVCGFCGVWCECIECDVLCVVSVTVLVLPILIVLHKFRPAVLN